MDNAKLCVLVVMACVIAPVCAGYVWPVTIEDKTIYEVDGYDNVSSDIATSQVGVYTDFTDAYINNMNVYAYLSDAYGGRYQNISAAKAVGYTYNPNSVPSFGVTSQALYLTTDSSGNYAVSDVANFIATQLLTGVGFIFNFGNFTGMVCDGVAVEFVVYYPSSNMMFYYDGSDYVNTTSRAFTWTGGTASSSVMAAVDRQVFVTSADGTKYVDISQGYYVRYQSSSSVASTSAFWVNGYTNIEADILLQLNEGNRVYLFFDDVNRYFLTRASSTLKIYSSTPSGTAYLGSIDDYPYIQIHVDTQTKYITVYGLIGMSGFDDDYTSKQRASIQLFQYTLQPFNKIYLFNTNNTGGDPTYYIPHTVSDITTTAGIEDNSMDLTLYTTTTGDGQILLKNLISWPTGEQMFSITVNNDYVYYGRTYADGMMTFVGSVDDETVNITVDNIQNMYVSKIGTTVYINGEPAVDTGASINHCVIGFAGQWITNIYYSDITTTTTDEYTWVAGGFGLGWSGIAMVGLLTSGGGGIAAMLYGRRSGGKALIVGITATMCAAAYLIILMTF